MTEGRRTKLQNILVWANMSALFLGYPMLLYLVSTGIQKGTFTATCSFAGWRCEYAVGADEAMASYMGDLLASNPGVDIVTTPKRR
jgi:hypothetical protein